MAAITPSKVLIKQEGDFAEYVFITTGTAADTMDISGYLHGRSICQVAGANVTDGANLAYTFTAAGVITVPAGPSADVLAIVVKLAKV